MGIAKLDMINLITLAVLVTALFFTVVKPNMYALVYSIGVAVCVLLIDTRNVLKEKQVN